MTVLRQRRCGCNLDGVSNAGRSKVWLDLVPSGFPEMSEAKGIDDHKQRLLTAILTPTRYAFYPRSLVIVTPRA